MHKTSPLFRTFRRVTRFNLAFVVALLAALPSYATTPDEAAAAETLVHTLYYEGMPYSEARALSGGATDHLLLLLEDENEAEWAHNIIMALAIADHPDALEAILFYEASLATGEVDRATYRTRVAIPFALGHLARNDDAALSALTARALIKTASSWSHGHWSDQNLAGHLQRLAISSLGISGRSEVLAILNQIALSLDAQLDLQLLPHLESTQALLTRIQSEGIENVFQGGN